jgi:hypothetical protein
MWAKSRSSGHSSLVPRHSFSTDGQKSIDCGVWLIPKMNRMKDSQGSDATVDIPKMRKPSMFAGAEIGH